MKVTECLEDKTHFSSMWLVVFPVELSSWRLPGVKASLGHWKLGELWCKCEKNLEFDLYIRFSVPVHPHTFPEVSCSAQSSRHHSGPLLWPQVTMSLWLLILCLKPDYYSISKLLLSHFTSRSWFTPFRDNHGWKLSRCPRELYGQEVK